MFVIQQNKLEFKLYLGTLNISLHRIIREGLFLTNQKEWRCLWNLMLVTIKF